MKFAIAVIAISIAPITARADWQFTRWGMTPSEVVAASNGTAKPTPPSRAVKDGDEAVKGTYRTGDFTFTVGYVFEKDRLVAIRLKPVPLKVIYKVGAQLDAVYGKPVQSSSSWDRYKVCLSNSKRWRDVDSGNEISYFTHACIKSQISDESLMATIAYAPIRSRAESGL
jgi:hypothetical protein